MKFEDLEEKGKYFQVRDVFWAEGYPPSSLDDDEPFEGWVVEYFPCSKGKKNAKSVRWGFRPNTPESASVAWTSYDHSYTTSGESSGEEDSFGYDENPTFMSENPTFMSQVSQDVSIYEGAIPSVFIRSNISQDVR